MKNIVIVLGGVCFFVSIALFRGISLGQNIDKMYLVVSVILSLCFGMWVYVLNKRK